MAVLILVLALLVSSPLFAYEAKQGTVSRIQVNSPSTSSRNVIVWLNGVSEMCAGISGDSAYFNKADSPDSFSVFVSTLLAAKAGGQSVLVLTIPGAEGCWYGDFAPANGAVVPSSAPSNSPLVRR